MRIYSDLRLLFSDLRSPKADDGWICELQFKVYDTGFLILNAEC